MFGEQLALSMAREGGVGLAETILRQLQGLRGQQQSLNASAPANQGAQRAMAVARAVRNTAAAPPSASAVEATAYATASVTAPPVTASLVTASPVTALPVTAAAPVTAAPGMAAVPVTAVPVTAAPMAAARPAHNLPTALKATPTASATPAPAPADVALHLPLRGRISSQFGTRRDPLQGGHRQHGGLDIAAPRGTAIAAAAPGKVVFAGRRGGYGNLVEIEHADGRRTRYAHAEKILVTPGEQVERGQAVATVGSTGRSTGPHLHFEVRENGSTVDPLAAVAKDSSTKRR